MRPATAIDAVLAARLITCRLSSAPGLLPMKTLVLLILSLVCSQPLLAQAPRTDVADLNAGEGLVWLAGTVRTDGGTMRVDLGDVHGVLEGDRLAVFRSFEDHHIPLGIVQIADAGTVWSNITSTSPTPLREGDLVLGVRTVRQTGTGENLQNGFLRRQLIRNGDRNGYSSADRVEVALTLRSLVRKQDRWAREKKQVAGSVRSGTITTAKFAALQPLRNHILLLRKYRETGIPLETSIGSTWENCITVLTPRHNVDNPALEADPETTSLALPADQQLKQRIEVIRDATSFILFDRFPEEQNLAVLICAAIEQDNPPNEALWIAVQLSRSQFPNLAEDREMLEEIPEILRRVRLAQNQAAF